MKPSLFKAFGILCFTVMASSSLEAVDSDEPFFVKEGDILRIPGNLHVEDVDSSVARVMVGPEGSGVISVEGHAHLAGTLIIKPVKGNYDHRIHDKIPYPVLVATQGISGAFDSIVVEDSHLRAAVVHKALGSGAHQRFALDLQLYDPFVSSAPEDLYLSLTASNYTTSNARAVARNLTAINDSTSFSGDPGLGNVFNILAAESVSDSQAGLEQLHPAQLSAFVELQMNVGSLVASAMHTRSYCTCPGKKNVELWVQPYGTWNSEKSYQDQLGFKMDGQGIAYGISYSPLKHFSMGLGGAYDRSKLRWKQSRGTGERKTNYAAAYLDYTTDYGHLGLSGIGGFDSYKVKRNIVFSSIDAEASSRSQGFQVIAQLNGSLTYGRPDLKVSPYFIFDYFYLYQGMLHETGAGSLNLKVESHSNGNLRSEIGFDVRPIVTLKHGCFVPWFGLAWIGEAPLFCPKYEAHFVDQSLAFKVKGWHHWWNFFSPQAGFEWTYKKFTFSAQYQFETGTGFFGQKGSVRCDLNF